MAPYVGWAKRIKSGFLDTCFLSVKEYLTRGALVHLECMKKVRSTIIVSKKRQIITVVKESGPVTRFFLALDA